MILQTESIRHSMKRLYLNSCKRMTKINRIAEVNYERYNDTRYEFGFG